MDEGHKLELNMVIDKFHSYGGDGLRKTNVSGSNSGLTLNVAKSKFCRKETGYLGYIIGNDVTRADPDKISAINDFLPQSRSRKLDGYWV